MLLACLLGSSKQARRLRALDSKVNPGAPSSGIDAPSGKSANVVSGTPIPCWLLLLARSAMEGHAAQKRGNSRALPLAWIVSARVADFGLPRLRWPCRSERKPRHLWPVVFSLSPSVPLSSSCVIFLSARDSFHTFQTAMRFLIAWDGSSESNKAVDLALDLLHRQRGDELVVVAVAWEQPFDVYLGTHSPIQPSFSLPTYGRVLCTRTSA